MMRPPAPRVRTFFLAVLSVTFVACQDSQVTPVELTPDFDISEARSGGNQDFFFAPPLAATPQPGDAGFDEGAGNAILVPYVRICETILGTPDPTGCNLDVTAVVTGSPTGLAMTFNSDTELYQVNWQTKDLDEYKEYRIEVWGIAFETEAEKAELDSRWLFGWRDIDNSPSTASCDATEEFCLINYGQTIPIKVRIEQFVFCPVARNCAVQFVAAGTDANLEAVFDPNDPNSLSGQLFIPGQQGTDFAVAFEPCTLQENDDVDNAIDLPTFGPCLKTLTNFGETLSTPAIVSICETFDLPGFAQKDQLTLHHFTETAPGEFRVEALPEAWNCDAPTSGGMASAGSSNRLLELARAVRTRVFSWISPRPLEATAVLIDRGGGGSTSSLESLFKLALPAKFEYVNQADANRTALAESDVKLEAKATDILDGDVENAEVHWMFREDLSSVGSDACVLVGAEGSACALGEMVTPTDPDGVARVWVRLSSTEGDNVFHASGRGIADDRNNGCTVTGQEGTASCNGPRPIEAATEPVYDPFFPLHVGLPDPMGVTETAVEIADGTRLPFTIFGCVPGRGTPNAIDGVMAPGEWDCANSQQFPVNLSGGSTVMATLFWMNDDTNFHLAVVVPGTGRQNGLRIDWDNNGNSAGQLQGSRELGDDVWEFDPDGGAADKFIDEKCSNSSQSGCGKDDTDFGGFQQTVADFDNTTTGGVTVYEMSHPIAADSADTRCGGNGKGFVCDDPPLYTDVIASASEIRGLFVTLRLGSGAQGNTQWPGFKQYLVIEIK